MENNNQSDETSIPHINKECFAGLEDNFRSQFILEPKDMVEIVKLYQQLEIIAKQKSSAAHKRQMINWNQLYKSAVSDIIPGGYVVEQPKDAEVDAWLDFVCAQYHAATGEHITTKVLDTLTRKDTKDLFMFQSEPAQAVADSHPLLKRIPGIFNKAQQIEFDRQRAIAKIMLKGIQKPICLVCDNIIVPDELGKIIKGTLQCWISLRHDESGMSCKDLEDASLFNMSAVFVDVEADGTAFLVATVVGYYIVPYKNNRDMHEETFKFMMDAHSVELNNVWKVVVGQFLPQHNFNNLYDFFDSFDDCVPGIASVSIDVRPNYRGNRMSGLMLGLISEMIGNADFFDYLAPIDMNSDEFAEFSKEYTSLSPIGLFVLGVEGTPPDALPIYAHLAYDTRTLPPKKVVNASVECRRLKLEKYFKYIGGQSSAFFIQTYNPWNYPIT